MQTVIASESAPTSQIVLPRGLIFAAALWLIGSLAVAMGFRTPVHATAASLEPGIRLMLQCVVVGLMIAWPLLRLSQEPTRVSVRQTLLDLIALLTILQIVVWVPRMFTIWTVSRTAALDAMLVSWAMLVGAIVASAIGGDRPVGRIVAMTACVTITLLGPLLIWIGAPLTEGTPNLTWLGPFMGVAHVAEGGATRPTTAQWQSITIISLAAGAAWVALGAVIGIKRLLRR